MTLLTLRPRRPRAGFTLIELLVVIAIIAVLVSLLMAAAMRVKDSGQRTENFDRIAQIGTAIGNAKSKNGMPYVWAGDFWLKGRYNTNDPELDLLTQMFPQMNHAGNSAAGEDNGYTGQPVKLDANQALVLLLTGGVPTNFTGFSNNPKKPFLAAAAGENRKGPYLDPNPKWYSTSPRGFTQNGHAWLVDVYGTPYAVLAATKGKVANYGVNNDGTAPQKIYNLVSPYQSGGKYVNESGFQIISAGKDQTFGPGGTDLPAGGTPGGYDDQANFSRSLLGNGIN